jgi:Mrp family chromosome partitioning ATPase
MSLNLLLEKEDDPVIWRGPILGSTVKQFYDDVVWGELDFLVVDLPPGTSDVTLTVMEQFNVDGIVVVSTPQDLVKIIVNKSIHMANRMNTPILGLVENMSYFLCDNCDEKHYLFGESRTKEVLDLHGIKLLAEMPIDKDLTALSDEGKIELYPKMNIDFQEGFQKNFLGEVNRRLLSK